MTWRGDKSLPKTFIIFLFVLAILIGEILPVVLENKPAGTPGAKESMFASWSMFIPTVVIYGLLGILFWWLFRKLHWLIVALIATGLGVLMEFTLMRPQEAEGPNVVENPLGALFFFIVIWPIILVIPYAVFQFLRRLINKRIASKSETDI